MDRYSEIILESVFPTHCIHCHADGSWCCQHCLARIEFVRGQPCSSCGTISISHTCSDQKQTLDGLVAVGFYHTPELRALIHGLKYQLATCLVPTIAEVIRRYAQERRDPWPWTGKAHMALQAVSGVPSRTRARGFDQAEVLRDIVQAEMIPWAKPVSLLTRFPGLSPQAELEVGPLRHANVRDSFSFAPPSQEALPQTVILVDDVFTTGSTMHEAACILKQAGVQSVYGFVLALGK